jgi:hippurate hydrolase
MEFLVPVLPQIARFHDEMRAFRHDLHAHPELGFEERRTSDLIAQKLGELGLEVHRGLGRTGVVGTLRVGNGPAIGLRAEMDALPIEEKNTFGYRSQQTGRMHACGHDGHSTMLLGAARYLAATRNFSGTVHFIFQPAEEGLGGAQAMIDDGLFEKFPVEAVHAIHNNPLQKAGTFRIRSGPMMAASGNFDIVMRGRGMHSGRPENGTDAIVASGALITALQTIVSRNVSPHDTAVVSVTKIHAGTAYNIIPEEVALSGNIRTYRPQVTDLVEAAIERIARGVAAQFGAEVDLKIRRAFPPLINHVRETAIAADIAADVVGEDNVDRNGGMFMASEDFSYMLRVRPGAYMIIGNGETAAEVHTPTYDFNDDLLPIGASYFARLVETTLPAGV